MAELIAEGTSLWDVMSLNQYDAAFGEGDWQELRLNFSNPVGVETARQIDDQLASQNAASAHEVLVEGNTLVVRTQVGFPPVWAIIGSILVALLLISFIGWTFYRITQEAPGAIKPVVDALKYVAVAGGLVIVLLIVREVRRG